MKNPICGHQSVLLGPVPGVYDREFDCDLRLAPLITELWRHKIAVYNCCQGDLWPHQQATLTLGAAEVEGLLQIVMASTDRNAVLADRIFNTTAANAWSYATHPVPVRDSQDGYVLCTGTEDCGCNDIIMLTQITMPAADAQHLVSILTTTPVAVSDEG